jgi:hypothetical protein
MTTLVFCGGLFGLAALVLGAAVWMAYRLGRANEESAAARTNDEVKNAQLAAAADRPDTRTDLLERLRRGHF